MKAVSVMNSSGRNTASDGMTRIPGAVIIEGHVQGLSNTRALGEAGIPVIVVDKSNCLARYSRYCTGFFYSPDFEKDEFAGFLLDLAHNENLEGWLLLPSNDHAVYTISRNREALGSVYSLITPDSRVIELIYDKKKLLGLASEQGVKIPVTQYFTTVHDKISPDLKFPVITKGRFGLSFYKAMKVKAILSNTEQELRARLSKIAAVYDLDKTLTQSVVPFDGSNRTISFTAFSVNGEIKCFWAGRKLREHPQRFGTATLAESIECTECYKPTALLLKRIGYTGVCEVEYIKDPEDGCYSLIEINARTWLWVGLAKACGVNYALMCYNHVNGLEIKFPEEYRKGVKWVNYLTDTWFIIKALLSGKVKPGDYFSSLQGDRVMAVFSRKDIMPSFALLFLSFYIARRRG
jgi:predicted ATP-grasp superfamily ATP-dependent carboligase